MQTQIRQPSHDLDACKPARGSRAPSSSLLANKTAWQPKALEFREGSAQESLAGRGESMEKTRFPASCGDLAEGTRLAWQQRLSTIECYGRCTKKLKR